MPRWAPFCQMPNMAPVGSIANASRPASNTSIGSATTWPPFAVIAAAVASALSEARYTLQPGREPSFQIGVIAAAGRSSR